MPVTLQRQGPVTLDRGLLPWTGGIVCQFQSLTEYSMFPPRHYMYSNPWFRSNVCGDTVVLNSWSWAHFFSLHLLFFWFPRHFLNQVLMSLNLVFILWTRLSNIIIVRSIVEQDWNIIVMRDIIDQIQSTIVVCNIVDQNWASLIGIVTSSSVALLVEIRASHHM